MQGDNLEALKSLLPYYAGKVKCIYIDPPYNSGNEGWVYNDNVNSPEIKAWLGKVVGKEAEDLSRHDKWLCMMYPRLRLLREFLREDGVLFVSIDDDEVHSLRFLLNEIFGMSAYIGSFVWKRRTGSMDETGNFSRDHDYVLAYQRGESGLAGDERTFAKYSNPDNDTRGAWISDNLSASKPGGDTLYPIKDPETGREFWPPRGRYWPYNPKTMQNKIAEGRIIFPSPDSDTPMLKRFKREAKSLFQPVSSWIGLPKDKDFTDEDGILHISTGMNSAATKNLKEIFGDKVFNYSKPPDLVRKLIVQATGPGDIILDSFAGSGTTGQAVFELNKSGGVNRKFILVELDEDIAPNIAAERLRRVIGGYDKGGNPDKPVEGLGGGFRFCRLGTPLFNEFGDIDVAVNIPDLAAHVFFSETGSPIPEPVDGSSQMIGQHKDKAVYLLFSNTEQGFAREASGNVLTPDVLADLPPVPDGFEGSRVVYAEGCTVAPDRLKAEGIVFKQIPYQIEGN